MDCPVRDCLYQAATAANLCHHFFNWHHSHSCLNLHEDRHVPSFCTLCGMSLSQFSLSQNHKGSKMCRRNISLSCQHIRKDVAAAAQLQVITINGVNLKKIENFRYLGRQICDTDLGSPALFMNLCKARKRLNRFFCLVARERKVLTQLLEEKSMLRQLYLYYRTGQKSGSGTLVCSIVFVAFIIVLVRGLLTRDQNDCRTVLTTTVKQMKQWETANCYQSKCILLGDGNKFIPTLRRSLFINYAKLQKEVQALPLD